ncbi:MAG: lytic transglycosylase domain-containing protein [Thermodesulfobacteriota bacterium]
MAGSRFHIARWTPYLAMAVALVTGTLLLYHAPPVSLGEGSLARHTRYQPPPANYLDSLPLEDRQQHYWPLVRRLAAENDVDPALVMAIIQVESSFYQLALSPRGAMGLMQINPITAQHLGLTDPLDAEANLEAGIQYLTQLKGHFKGNLDLVLAAYNAGPTRVAAVGRVPNIPETRRYVKAVREKMDYFRTRFMTLAMNEPQYQGSAGQ